MKHLNNFNKYFEDRIEFNNIGEWIETLSDDDYVMNIVNRYLKEIDPSIELSNAINLLDDKEKSDIKGQVERYLNGGIEEKDPIVLTSTRTSNITNSRGLGQQFGVGSVGDKFVGESVENQNEITVAGKGIFNSFLKSITALGRKESEPNYKDCPKEFLMFYYYEDLDSDSVKSVFNRFKSLARFSEIVDYKENYTSLYFGIRSDGQFEYGVGYENLKPMGRFKLNKSTIKWIVQLNSKAAHSLKKELVNLSFNEIITLGDIKRDMENFKPGYHEGKRYPSITDRVITFAYKGVGKWENGKMDQTEYERIKTLFSEWVIKKKWGSKVLINIQPSSFWLNINIKLK